MQRFSLETLGLWFWDSSRTRKVDLVLISWSRAWSLDIFKTLINGNTNLTIIYFSFPEIQLHTSLYILYWLRKLSYTLHIWLLASVTDLIISLWLTWHTVITVFIKMIWHHLKVLVFKKALVYISASMLTTDNLALLDLWSGVTSEMTLRYEFRSSDYYRLQLTARSAGRGWR